MNIQSEFDVCSFDSLRLGIMNHSVSQSVSQSSGHVILKLDGSRSLVANLTKACQHFINHSVGMYRYI